MQRFAPLVVFAVFVASCAPTVNVEQEKTALIAVDVDWSKSVGDMDKFGSFLAPNATFTMSGAPALHGDKAIRDTLSGLMKAPGFALTWKATRVEVSASGDLGYTAGSYALTIDNAAGVASTEKGEFLTAWKKINGVWKVVEDTAVPNSPPMVSSPGVVTPAAAPR